MKNVNIKENTSYWRLIMKMKVTIAILGIAIGILLGGTFTTSQMDTLKQPIDFRVSDYFTYQLQLHFLGTMVVNNSHNHFPSGTPELLSTSSRGDTLVCTILVPKEQTKLEKRLLEVELEYLKTVFEIYRDKLAKRAPATGIDNLRIRVNVKERR